MVSRTAWSWGVACPPRSARGGGAVHVADDVCGSKHGHLAVCPGQGLEEGFRGVAKGDAGVDDVELRSVPDDLIVCLASLGC